MTSITTTLEYLFGCHHGNLSRVFTLGGRSYRVCCDCGAQFSYSLDSMSIEHRKYRPVSVRHLVHMTDTR